MRGFVVQRVGATDSGAPRHVSSPRILPLRVPVHHTSSLAVPGAAPPGSAATSSRRGGALGCLGAAHSGAPRKSRSRRIEPLPQVSSPLAAAVCRRKRGTLGRSGTLSSGAPRQTLKLPLRAGGYSFLLPWRIPGAELVLYAVVQVLYRLGVAVGAFAGCPPCIRCGRPSCFPLPYFPRATLPKEGGRH